MSKADDILFFDVIFLLMVVTFSAGTTSGFTLSNFTSQIFAPWPDVSTLFKPLASCQNTDAGCIAQNLNTATSWIGAGIIALVELVFTGSGGNPGLIARITLFGSLITTLLFNPAINGAGVPFLPIIIVGLNIYVVWEAIRTLRGSSTGV